MKFENMTISDYFEKHTEHVIIINSEEKTLFNSLVSGDYPPDILGYRIKNINVVENVPIITVKD